jgi:ketosteroid isomerase-like protein
VPRTTAEMVLAFIGAINRRDWEAVFTDANSDFEIDLSRAIGPYRGVYGIEDAQQLFGEFAESWQSLRIEAPADDLVETDDAVLATLTMNVQGRDGINVTSTVTWVWTVRGGKLVRASMYQERVDALAAFGISTP